MLIGYARVSTRDQNLKLQRDALKQAGCERIFKDKESGIKNSRPGLDKALSELKKNDVLVVWRLDRLGRSLKNLIEIVTELKTKGVGFKSLQENIDTTTSGGKLVFHFFAALAEFEREVIRERTHAGLKAARARGRVGGRPKIMNEKKLELAINMMDDFNNSVDDVCKTINVSRTTLYRYLKSPVADKIRKRKDPKTIKVKLWLRVERNSKFVRGMKKSRRMIEEQCLSRYDMKKEDLDSWEYILKLPYESENDLNNIIDELCMDMESIAESNHCFTEADFFEINGDRAW